MSYEPTIELHPLYIVKCKQCKEIQMVKMVEGNLPADVECECGAIIKRKRIFNSPIAFFWDCDNCGNEIFNALPYEIDDLAQIIVEDGINVQCPICWTKYGFDEAGIGHVVK